MIYHSFFIVGKTSIRLISLFFPGFLWYTVYTYMYNYNQLYTYQYVYHIYILYLFHFIDSVLRLVTSKSLSSAGHEALDRAAKDRHTVLYAVPVAWESQLAALGICGVLW